MFLSPFHNASQAQTFVLEAMPYKNGQRAHGRKPKRSEYTSTVRTLIDKACGLYNVKIMTVNAFPPMELEARWVAEVWAAVCTEAKRQFSSDDSDSERIGLLVRSCVSS